MDFSKSIKLIEKKIGYTFRDKSLLQQAFTRTSYCNEKNYRGRDNYSSNEVLEFFGDSVLSTAIISLLLRSKTEKYEHGIKTELNEGDLSNIKSKLSDKRNLAKSTAELGLQKFLLLGEGDDKLGISEEASVMEDLFESIIGAIYIDSEMNIETVIGVVSSILDLSIYTSSEALIQSYKNALQEWCADKKNRLPPPTYKTLSESGPDHKKSYERACYIGDRLLGVGVGKNQKAADTAAAEAALKALMLEEDQKGAKSRAESAEGSARALRELASKRKLPSPEYHDLGEAPNSTEGARAYIVECRFMDFVASAQGPSKQEARDSASAKILEALSNSEKKKEAKTTSGSQKATRKQINKQSANKVKSNSASKSNTKSRQKPQDDKGKKATTNSTPKRKPLHHTKRS